MYHLLYETTNKLNGKRYRGIHSTNNYYDGYLGSGGALYAAIKKYGKENFTREVLVEAQSRQDLIELEKKYVDTNWVQRKDTYNACVGGIQVNSSSSISTREKISKTLTGRKVGPRSEDVKRKISETMKGRISPMRGMKHSAATKEKMRQRALETLDFRTKTLRGEKASTSRDKYYENRRV